VSSTPSVTSPLADAPLISIHTMYSPGQTDGERKEWLMLDTLSSREWTDSVEQLRAMMEVTLLAPYVYSREGVERIRDRMARLTKSSR